MYDIPPPLQHKEKIIFGLTFSQLAVAAPAALIIFFIILKTPLPVQISGIISLLIAAIASFFMFFDGINKIKNFYNYKKNPKLKTLSKKLKEIIDIENIKDTIQLKTEKLAIIEVIPLNFMLKTKEEQEAILKSFQKFLNSLDFPIQIHITSTPISLSQHFKEANNKVRPQLKTLLDDYCTFVRKTVKDIQNRKFYIIIKEQDGLRSTLCQERLNSIGLKTRILQEPALVKLFTDYVAREKKEIEETEDLAHYLYAPKEVSFSLRNFCLLLSIRLERCRTTYGTKVSSTRPFSSLTGKRIFQIILRSLIKSALLIGVLYLVCEKATNWFMSLHVQSTKFPMHTYVITFKTPKTRRRLIYARSFISKYFINS